MLKFEHGLGAFTAHVLNGFLIADIVGTLDRVIHVPAPIVVRVCTGNCTGDTALRRNSVRARREDFADHGSFVAGLGQLQCSTHTGTTTAHNDSIK